MYAATLEGSMTTPAEEVQPIQLDDYQRAALLELHAQAVLGRPPARLDERALWREQWATALLLGGVAVTAPDVSVRLDSIASALEAEAVIADTPSRYESLASLADEVRQIAREREDAPRD